MCFLLPFAFRGPPESFASSSSSPAGMSKVPSHAKSLEKHGMWTIFGVQSGQSGQNNHESALIPFTVQLKIGQSMSCNGNIYYIYIYIYTSIFCILLVGAGAAAAKYCAIDSCISAIPGLVEPQFFFHPWVRKWCTGPSTLVRHMRWSESFFLRLLKRTVSIQIIQHFYRFTHWLFNIAMENHHFE